MINQWSIIFPIDGSIDQEFKLDCGQQSKVFDLSKARNCYFQITRIIIQKLVFFHFNPLIRIGFSVSLSLLFYYSQNFIWHLRFIFKAKKKDRWPFSNLMDLKKGNKKNNLPLNSGFFLIKFFIFLGKNCYLSQKHKQKHKYTNTHTTSRTGRLCQNLW